MGQMVAMNYISPTISTIKTRTPHLSSTPLTYYTDVRINNYGQYLGSMSNHDKVYQNVIEVLTNGGVIATNGFEGLKTVEIIDKIYSAQKMS